MLSVWPSAIGPLNKDLLRMRMTLSLYRLNVDCKITPAHSQNNHIFYFTKSESMLVRWMYANTLAQIPHVGGIHSAFQCACFMFINAHSAVEWSFISYLFKLICLVPPVAGHLIRSPKTSKLKGNRAEMTCRREWANRSIFPGARLLWTPNVEPLTEFKLLVQI